MQLFIKIDGRIDRGVMNVNEVIYPPEEFFNVFKKNFEHLLLWMLSNNEECQWADFVKQPLSLSTSTLSKYFNLLKSKGYVEKFSRGQYKITPSGRKRFYEISSTRGTKKKLNYPPDLIKRKRDYEDWILWMVYNNSYCRWGDFIEAPLSINRSSLSKKMNLLLEKGFVSQENKEYTITNAGKIEYSKMLQKYDLDRQSILDEESKRIDEITVKMLKFFKQFEVKDEDLQFRFLANSLKLDYDRVKSLLRNQTDFEKILLFLSINHPDNYPHHITLEDFAKQYGIDQTKLKYYVDEIIGQQIYPIKFFKLNVSDKIHYYFQENEPLETRMRAITGQHITKATYLNRLYSRQFDTSTIEQAILTDICKNLFDDNIKSSLTEFLPDYMNYLAYKMEAKVEFKGSYDKLDVIIWQNLIDVIQSRNPKDLQFQFIGQNEINYKLDTTILEIARPYYSNKQISIIKVIQHLIDTKEFIQALDMVEAALESDQGQLLLIMLKAILLCYLNRNRDVLDFLEDHGKFPHDEGVEQGYAVIFFLLVFSSLTLGDFETSLEYSDRTRQLFPNHPLSHAACGLALVYNVLYDFDPEKAIEENGLEELDKAIELDASKLNQALFLQLKSRILLQLNARDESLQAIDHAIKLAPKRVELYHSKGSILMYYNQYEELLTLLDHILELFPKLDKELKLKKALVCKQLGNLDGGFSIIEELLGKYPKDNAISNSKAYWYVYMNKKEEAIETIENLIRQDPEIGLNYDTYGEILMYYEDYEEAIEQFQKALARNKFGLLIHETYIKLGVSYKELKDYDQALENLRMGKKYTQRCSCDLETKRKWLTIADLFITEIEQFL
jgi:tetratricopeptide (TPR) repeat protein